MMLMLGTILLLICGNILQSFLNAREKKKNIDEIVNLRREKFDRDLNDAKKQIRKDIDSESIDELLKSE